MPRVDRCEMANESPAASPVKISKWNADPSSASSLRLPASRVISTYRKRLKNPPVITALAALRRKWRHELSCRELSDGSLVWATEVGRLVPEFPVHKSNTYATETPASDGKHIFVTFGALGQVAAYDLEGEEKWRVDTGVFSTGNDFGWGISLVYHDGLVFVQNDNEEDSFLVALDSANGEERWRAQATGELSATPAALPGSVIVAGADGVVARYDTDDGGLVWRKELGVAVTGDPTVLGNTLVMGLADGRVVALGDAD